MKSLILKATTLALAAALVLSTAGADTAEARRGHHGFQGHHGHHGFHGHRHAHRHVWRPVIYSGCYWARGHYGRYWTCK